MRLQVGDAATWIFLVVFFAMFIFVAYRLLRYGGFSGALFAQEVDHTLGEVRLLNTPDGKFFIRVHRLRSTSPKRWVGMEFHRRNYGEFKFAPLHLSSDEALTLARLLQEAVGQDDPGPAPSAKDQGKQDCAG